MHAPADPGGNRCALRPPPNSASWRPCGPKAGPQSRFRPRPARRCRLAAAGCPDSASVGSAHRAQAPWPGIISQAGGPRAKEGSRRSCRLLGGWRLRPAKVTQHEPLPPELEEREGAAQRAERGCRLSGRPSGLVLGLCPEPQESRVRACSDLRRKVPGFQENPVT